MTRLSSEQVLKDNNTREPNSISTLHLSFKALSDVSCLSYFKNLEKLDLKLNNLTSLEGLKSCVNLKWLCVVENKLESLEGIQGLTKLAVLNAGRNMLKSMDQVRTIASLRALILNENEIVSICKLDQMKDLNTLVLSKNPICKIGDTLVKVKSLTKLSLSHCQLDGIDSSLKSCVDLRELRRAHNEIKSLPDEIIYNIKLQNLDLGNNVITRWSDIKVVKSLLSLKNLNLQGNAVATNDKVATKIRKALPNLQIFNARPIGKYTKNEKCNEMDGVDDFSVQVTDKIEGREEKDHTKEKESAKHHLMGPNRESETATDLSGEKPRKKRKKASDIESKRNLVLDNENRAKDKGDQFNLHESNGAHFDNAFDCELEGKSIQEKQRKEIKFSVKTSGLEENLIKKI
ncbi:Protein phosphatase 1 regulatory subunit 7 [Quillaja saponaria]|uniref:Protein phosphatase 1 regulatory subunit 7 n=1 Tax=Quillaja saponaria TaxID=32244 RepID=A0AAD7PAT3_QUISA|nr:Protein phosphatase 1 regulatory subunit 7 [Quillaja saponaria]